MNDYDPLTLPNAEIATARRLARADDYSLLAVAMSAALDAVEHGEALVERMLEATRCTPT